MNKLLSLLTLLYRGCLHLYPPAYRLTFGEELVQVFELTLHETSAQSIYTMFSRLFREFIDLPGVIFRLHLRQRRLEMPKNLLPQSTDQTPWGIALLSLLPIFIIGPLMIIFSYQPWWNPEQYPSFFSIYTWFVVALILASLVIGVLKNFPRWSYIYFGFSLIMIVSLITYLINRTPFDFDSEWILIILIPAILFLITYRLPLFHAFYQNIRSDWTYLSYALYAFTLLMLISQDRSENPTLNWMAWLPPLIGLLGALAHLRLQSAGKRIAVLIFSMLVGVFIELLPVFNGNLHSSTARMMVISLLLVMWAVLAALLLLPMLVNVFHRTPPQSDSANEPT